MHLCSANLNSHRDSVGHSVKCSPTAGMFRLHRRTAPDQSYRLYDSNNIYYICGRLSDHLFVPRVRLFEFATETAAVFLYPAQSKLKQLITR